MTSRFQGNGQPDAENTPSGGPQEQDGRETVAAIGLLECLVHVARIHGLPANPPEIREGLPAAKEGLPFSYMAEAAARIGLASKSEARSLTGIPAVTFPVIVVLKDGSCAVLKERQGGRLVLYVPAPVEGTRTVRLKDLAADYGGVCIFLTPDEDALPPQEPGAPAGTRTGKGAGNWFWPAVRTFWPNYLQVALCGLLVNVLALATPLFTMNVYDRVIPNLAIPTLWTLTLGVGLALLFDFFLRLLRTSIVDQTGRRVDMAISGRLYDHLLSLKLHARPSSSGNLSNQIREFDSVRDLITSNTVIALLDIVFIGLFLYVIWQLVGPLAYVVTAAVPLVLCITILCQLPLDRAMQRSLQDSGRRHGLLFETLSGLETVKSTGAGSWLRRRWDRNVALSARSSANARFWNGLAFSFLTTVQQGTSIIVTVWGVFLILQGEITMGAVIATNILSGRVLAPLANVAQTMARLSQARTAIGSLNSFMSLPTDRKETGAALPRPAEGAARLTVKDVTVAYPGQAVPALDKVSFQAGAGERIGIIGLVGAGKSTLGRVACGLIDPSEGHVLINGIDSRQFGPATLRRAIVYCGQEPDIFSGTVRDNLIMGRPFADDTDIMEAVQKSGLDRHVAQNQKGLDMPVLERGRNLSGGQRQAIALARIFLSAPPFLYLDEPSAAMDKGAETALMTHLVSLSRQGTALLIATHKDSVLRHVDRILVLDRGKLAMDGPRDQVLQKLSSLPAQGKKVQADAGQG